MIHFKFFSKNFPYFSIIFQEFWIDYTIWNGFFWKVIRVYWKGRSFSQVNLFILKNFIKWNHLKYFSFKVKFFKDFYLKVKKIFYLNDNFKSDFQSVFPQWLFFSYLFLMEYFLFNLFIFTHFFYLWYLIPSNELKIVHIIQLNRKNEEDQNEKESLVVIQLIP